MVSKCDKNMSDTLCCAFCLTFRFFTTFDVIREPLLNRRATQWNLFVKIISARHADRSWLIVNRR